MSNHRYLQLLKYIGKLPEFCLFRSFGCSGRSTRPLLRN